LEKDNLPTVRLPEAEVQFIEVDEFNGKILMRVYQNVPLFVVISQIERQVFSPGDLVYVEGTLGLGSWEIEITPTKLYKV
jgi:hypothetical protein